MTHTSKPKAGVSALVPLVRGWLALIGCVAARAYLGTLLGFLVWTMLPMAAGAQTSIVMSGSMMPSLHPGDAIVRSAVTVGQLKPGQVIVVDDPDHPGRLRMHRLVKVRPDGTLILRGDANKRPDSTPVEPTAVRGLARLRVPYVASPALWLRTGRLGHAAGWLLLTLGAVLAAPGSHRKDRDTGKGPGRDAPDKPQDGATRSWRQVSWRPARWRRRSSAVALFVPLLVMGPLGSGPALAAYTATASNPASSFTAASSFCANPGTTTVSATADSTVNQASPTANTGTATTLSVASGTTTSNQRALVNFTLPTTPSHCTVTAAVLTLTATSGNTTRTLSVTGAPTAWTETGVTWNNQPTPTGTATTKTAVTTGALAFTVTAQVQAMYAGTNNGLTVRDQTESAGTPAKTQTFSSREGANPPKLAVTFG